MQFTSSTAKAKAGLKSKSPSAGYYNQILTLMKTNEVKDKKLKQPKWWQLPHVSLPVLQAIPAHNKKISEARIVDLEKRVEHKKKLAREHLAAGRDGKAEKMANRARAIDREIAKIKRML